MRTRVALVGIAVATAVSVVLTGGASAAHVYPATSTWPTAGFCDTTGNGRTVTVVLYADMSGLRCYEVRKSQHLRFVNRSKHAMRLLAPFLGFTLQPGQARTLHGALGSYLAPGDHSVGSSAWCCFGFDIFLPGAPQPQPTGGVG